jgi:hypothetical protein
MTLQEKIENAFAHRRIPTEVVEMEGRLQFDSDVEDAIWFKRRDWHDLTREDWHQHHWGFHFFSPEGFAYLLPSLLLLTILNPKEYPGLAVDSFLSQLDRSQGAENLETHLINRYSLFNEEEFNTIKEWLLFACESFPQLFHGAAASGPGDGFGRVFDTVDLLQKTSTSQRHVFGDME